MELYNFLQNPIVHVIAGVLFMFYVLIRFVTIGEFEERRVDSKKSGGGYVDWRNVYLNSKYVISFFVFFIGSAYVCALGFVLCQIIFFYIKI